MQSLLIINNNITNLKSLLNAKKTRNSANSIVWVEKESEHFPRCECSVKYCFLLSAWWTECHFHTPSSSGLFEVGIDAFL